MSRYYAVPNKSWAQINVMLAKILKINKCGVPNKRAIGLKWGRISIFSKKRALPGVEFQKFPMCWSKDPKINKRGVPNKAVVLAKITQN